MDIKNVEEENKNQNQKRIGGLDQNRVVINKDANLCLEKIVKKANKGFDAGIITKSDLANFVFQNLENFISESDYKKIRSLHFDDKKVLNDLLRKTEVASDLPEEIKRVLREHYGLFEKDKKKSFKPESELSTENTVDKI